MEVLMSRGPIITLSDGNFTRYAEGKDRPYHIVVLFTAAAPSYNCMACRYLLCYRYEHFVLLLHSSFFFCVFVRWVGETFALTLNNL